MINQYNIYFKFTIMLLEFDNYIKISSYFLLSEKN